MQINYYFVFNTLSLCFILYLSTVLGPLQVVVQLTDTEGVWVGGVDLLFPRVSALLLFPGQERVSVPHGSSCPKAGVLLPPLGAGNKGRAQHGRHCRGALEEASLWGPQDCHLFILLMSFPWQAVLWWKTKMWNRCDLFSLIHTLKQCRFHTNIWFLKGIFSKSGFKGCMWCGSPQFPGEAVQQCNECHLPEAFTASKVLFKCFTAICITVNAPINGGMETRLF